MKNIYDELLDEISEADKEILREALRNYNESISKKIRTNTMITVGLFIAAGIDALAIVLYYLLM